VVISITIKYKSRTYKIHFSEVEAAAAADIICHLIFYKRLSNQMIIRTPMIFVSNTVIFWGLEEEFAQHIMMWYQ
jgi:hypothetical protein